MEQEISDCFSETSNSLYNIYVPGLCHVLSQIYHSESRRLAQGRAYILLSYALHLFKTDKFQLLSVRTLMRRYTIYR